MEESRLEGRERKQFLPGIPAECFELHQNKPGVFAPSHWHSAAELVYVREGGYRILAGGEERLLRPGECVLIRPGQLHTTICPPLPAVSLVVLKFEPGLLRGGETLRGEAELLAQLQHGPGAAVWLDAEEVSRRKIGELLERILAESREKQMGWRMGVRAGICTILLEVLRAEQRQPQGSGMGTAAASEEFFPVLEYLEQHYREEIRVSDLLEICHLSYSRFSVKFRQLTGFRFTEYLHRMRIEYARRLLESGGESIGQIAERCGYLDLCYFDRLFRRYTGISPKDYRRELRGKEEQS
ncbi:MAG: helix-turn-helix domain-containing protein [Candidatus Merdivicinus sp.]|jgi:AraC-like DNA-binding protein